VPGARQRWRLVVARAAEAPRLGQRELNAAWLEALETSALPLYRAPADARPKVAFAAPLAPGVAAEGELVDVILTERWPTWRVRETVTRALPDGWALVDLYDVWLAGPALAGQVAAADYRITVEPAAGVAAPGALEAAAAALLAAPTLPRERAKGEGTIRYDLRPLLVDLRVRIVAPDAGAAARTVVWARTRIHPELGTGRPDEVIAALGVAAGVELAIDSIVRERLLLLDELGSD
jgi:radical SAM-linked protein